MILHQRTVFKRLNIVSTGLHEGKLQEAVQALKYDHAEMLKYPLAHRLKAAIEQVNWQPHLISAIPLHKNRQKQRGYNQAELLAQTLSDLAHIPYQADIFQRVQDTRSQVGLTRQERLQNVIAAFHADPQHVKGKRILLVDDVATTGATLTACAQSAIKQGADAVYGLTVTTAQ